MNKCILMMITGFLFSAKIVLGFCPDQLGSVYSFLKSVENNKRFETYQIDPKTKRQINIRIAFGFDGKLFTISLDDQLKLHMDPKIDSNITFESSTAKECFYKVELSTGSSEFSIKYEGDIKKDEGIDIKGK